MPSPLAYGVQSAAMLSARTPPLTDSTDLIASSRSPCLVFTTNPDMRLGSSCGDIATSRTFPTGEVPDGSYTGAPIRSESASEGITANIVESHLRISDVLDSHSSMFAAMMRPSGRDVFGGLGCEWGGRAGL